MPTRPAACACPAHRAPRAAGPRDRAAPGVRPNAGCTRAQRRLPPWTIRRIPAALNPLFWPVSGLANTPLHLPGRARHPVAVVRMRLACGEAALHRAWRDAFAYRCGGSTGWRRPRRGRASCFPFNCARQNARASTETRASVGATAGSVKAAGGDRLRRPASSSMLRRTRASSIDADWSNSVLRDIGKFEPARAVNELSRSLPIRSPRSITRTSSRCRHRSKRSSPRRAGAARPPPRTPIARAPARCARSWPRWRP